MPQPRPVGVAKPVLPLLLRWVLTLGLSAFLLHAANSPAFAVDCGSCNDGNVCTFDYCGPSGQCIHDNIAMTGTDCTPSGSCVLMQCIRGECTGAAGIPCDDDGDPCTDEVCPNRACAHLPKPEGAPCGHGICTTVPGFCQQSQCVGEVLSSCDDGNACTTDACTTTQGCTHSSGCDDSNVCTNDVCLGPATGCSFIPRPGSACDDGNACTFGDACTTDAIGHLVCAGTNGCPSDNNPCTDEVFDPETCECLHTPLQCDDGIPCTADFCGAGGACVFLAVIPSEVVSLQFIDSLTLQWIHSPEIGWSDTYRGTIPASLLGSRAPGSTYDHACFESGDAFGDGPEQSKDATVPVEGDAFYYLVSGENACGEGDLGQGLSGAGGGPIPRPTPLPCP
jgi:hypothetical protein